MSSNLWPIPELSRAELYYVLLDELGVSEEQLGPLHVPEAEAAPLLAGLKTLARLRNAKHAAVAQAKAGPGTEDNAQDTHGADAISKAVESQAILEADRLLAGLQALGWSDNEQELPPGLFCPVRPRDWDETKAREARHRFLQALALPEPRIRLAEATGFSYEQITRWVIRADLLRLLDIEMGDKPLAEILSDEIDGKLLTEILTKVKIHGHSLAEVLVDEGDRSLLAEMFADEGNRKSLAEILKNNGKSFTEVLTKVKIYGKLLAEILVDEADVESLAELLKNNGKLLAEVLANKGDGKSLAEILTIVENNSELLAEILMRVKSNIKSLVEILKDRCNGKLIAEKLADKGVIGVHDLATCTERGGLDRLLNDEQYTKEGQPEDGRAMLIALFALAKNEARNGRAQIVATTEAILVVKGAGQHQQDQTLDAFLKGFWPAIAHLNPKATLAEYRPTTPSEHDAPGDPDSGSRIAEMSVGERRLWIKEAYWEPGVRAPGSLPALLIEWRLATYVLGRVIWELVSPFERESRSKKTTDGDLFNYFIALSIAHYLIFVLIALIFWNLPVAWLPIPPGFEIPFALFAPFVLAALASIPPAFEADIILRERKKNYSKHLERLPGISGWLLITLIGAFLIHPVRYLLFLLVLILLQILLIAFRKQAWPYREMADSDTNWREWYAGQSKDEHKRSNKAKNRLQRFVLSPCLYRYIVVVGLPIIVLLLLLASVLQAIPGLRAIGGGIESFADATLSGGLGDVVIYATDPGQAAWIRGAIVADLKMFDERPDVAHIHLFAHSQGTPITFETLFYHLHDSLRDKIKTYVTIGSVLGYLNQANPVLDLLLIHRFPRLPYPTFSEDFKWLNFWNHGDPITSFSALDAYRGDQLEQPSTQATQAGEAVRPINVRTKGTWLPWTSHSEYWTNLKEVQQPFARRVLGYLDMALPATVRQVLPPDPSHADYILRRWVPPALLLVLVGALFIVWLPPEWMPLGPLGNWLDEQDYWWYERVKWILEIDTLTLLVAIAAYASWIRQGLALRRFNTNQ